MQFQPSWRWGFRQFWIGEPPGGATAATRLSLKTRAEVTDFLQAIRLFPDSRRAWEGSGVALQYGAAGPDGDVAEHLLSGRITVWTSAEGWGVPGPPELPPAPPAEPPPPGPGGDAPPPAPSTKHKSGKGGSTTVEVDDKAKVIRITTCMEFGGPDATDAYAKAAKKQIEESWSGNCTRNGEPYKVAITVNAKVRKAGDPPRPDCDQINVDKANTRMNQTLFGAGPGNQNPGAATDAARPRRIAHEYGHTLGLDDDYEDTPTGSRPKTPVKPNNIMAETWPDSKGVMPHPHQDHYDQILKNYGY